MSLRLSKRVLFRIVFTSIPAGAAAQSPSPYPIQHVIVIMQENRSFDNYFGTFPGANGFPAGTCVAIDPANPAQGCVAPFHDVHDSNSGGPHNASDAEADLDDGMATAKMDGFIRSQIKGGSKCSSPSIPDEAAQMPIKPQCVAGINNGIARHDVMGYHTDAEIPNYWAYAENFVLQDSMFEGDRGWSGDSHLEMTSEWTARCKKPTDLSTCTTTMSPPLASATAAPIYPWVNLFQLMDTNNVSWKYYLGDGPDPDCDDGQMTCDPQNQQSSKIPTFWNPVPGFTWVRQQGSLYASNHEPTVDQLLLDLKNGTLPQVSWVIPSFDVSEHPTFGVTAGMEYVTSLVNAVMQSPYWQSTAIFISWDDWGGFYDHVVPPILDYAVPNTVVQGMGLRVPGLLISPYAMPGLIDHQVLSFDSYAVLIEQLFMNGVHLDPVAMGQPDNRPTVRDELTTGTYPDGTTAQLGQLINEFDFTQTPLPPLILSTHIPTGITATCGSHDGSSQDCKNTKVVIKWVPVAGAQVPGPFTYTLLRDGAVVCTTTKVSCTDSTASSGAHFYTVYSTDAANVASPPSAAAEADLP